ncbi:hypothetical protein QBC33DRAFT_282382 [Phialemonium atrogriseum]|uniref:Uncharacterized protein n=1 Tax=Phialemonium atrogriseum TaxID=1093897 RepID=A0AAJ0BQF6_9PEZI|nr:uncharacterized protein QBC33DRAFT_282382 [Phialemonium atrogriseum]KAK1762575.1 hypothetical protein QBC33DRAFT_282382 [Phialemonium atrogriseum]
MVTITNLITDMESIVRHINSIPAKFEHSALRPSSQEVSQLRELATKTLQHAQTLHRKLTDCATEWAPEVYEKADKHMSQARPAIQAMIQGQIKGPILRRNLVAIFQGRQPSTVDSPQVKARKAKRTQKCETLRSLGPATVLAWGGLLPT